VINSTQTRHTHVQIETACDISWLSKHYIQLKTWRNYHHNVQSTRDKTSQLRIMGLVKPSLAIIRNTT